jgi:hypothetical protein
MIPSSFNEHFSHAVHGGISEYAKKGKNTSIMTTLISKATQHIILSHV